MNNDFGTIIEPAPVPFTFGAPGWYVLTALIGCVLLLLIWIGIHLYKKNRYRASAVRWLMERERILDTTQGYEVLVYDSSMLIKRIAMSRYGRTTVASVTGQAWIDFLNQTSHSTQFSDTDVQLLTHGLYQPGVSISEAEAKAFVLKTKTWIARHKYAL